LFDFKQAVSEYAGLGLDPPSVGYFRDLQFCGYCCIPSLPIHLGHDHPVTLAEYLVY